MPRIVSWSDGSAPPRHRVPPRRSRTWIHWARCWVPSVSDAPTTATVFGSKRRAPVDRAQTAGAAARVEGQVGRGGVGHGVGSTVPRISAAARTEAAMTGDADGKVYIHEFIDIIGHNRAKYFHHMTANWCPSPGRAQPALLRRVGHRRARPAAGPRS